MYYCKTISPLDEIWTRANCVANKLFITFLFSDHVVGVQFFVGCGADAKQHYVV